MNKPLMANDAAADNAPVKLLAELDLAYDNARTYLTKMINVLDAPHLCRGTLTSLRLKLAQLRLVQASAVSRIYDFVIANGAPNLRAEAQDMRINYHRLLQLASVHTAKWSLDFIQSDWLAYVKVTRPLLDLWSKQMILEREQLSRLLQLMQRPGL